MCSWLKRLCFAMANLALALSFACKGPGDPTPGETVGDVPLCVAGVDAASLVQGTYQSTGCWMSGGFVPFQGASRSVFWPNSVVHSNGNTYFSGCYLTFPDQEQFGFEGPSGFTAFPTFYSSSIAARDYPLAISGAPNDLVVAGNDVYLAGYSVDSNNNYVPGYLKNGQWIALPCSSSATYCRAFCLVVSGSDVYVGGTYVDFTERTAVLGYWKNGTWTQVEVLAANLDTPDQQEMMRQICFIRNLVVQGSDVYLVGFGPKAEAGYWKNGTWVALPVPAGSAGCYPNWLVVQLNDVYVLSGSGTIGYWKNGAWVGLPSPDASPSSMAMAVSLAVDGDNVAVAGEVLKNLSSNGDFQSSSVSVPGLWQNGVWNPLSVPDTASSNGMLVVSMTKLQ